MATSTWASFALLRRARPQLFPTNENGRNADLDGLRGLAILMVLYTHIGWVPNLPFAHLGWIGVDIFFTLSGFLITSILLKRVDAPDYYRHFYRRRSLRIFPAFYLVLAAALAVSLAKHSSGTWQIWSISGLFLTSLFAKYLVLHASSLPYFVFEGLHALWSVSIEEIFYLLWAPMVRLVRNPARLAAVLACILVAEPFVRLAFHTPQYPEYWSFFCRLDGLAVGSLIAIFLHTGTFSAQRLRRIGNSFLAAVVLADVPVFLLTGSSLATRRFAAAGYSFIALTAGAALLWLVVHRGDATVPQRLLSSRAMRYFGRRSYMLYLCQQFLLIPFQTAFARHLGDRAYLAGGLFALPILLLIAETSWRLLEGPLLAERHPVVIERPIVIEQP